MLVFSKTSLQRDRISPKKPRAVYFGDEVYVGYCRSGEVLEVSAVDPQLGAVFYTLDQSQVDRPRFQRQTDNCLVCHSSSRTGGVPGHLVRSLYANESGEPILSAGSHTVDHTTPLAQRWGGWYVTGEHGAQTHLGNLVVAGRQVQEPVDNAQGQNVTQLAGRLRLETYLSEHSDIVALMVLEHQTLVHNRLAKANFATRSALHYQTEMNRAFGQPEATVLESVTRRIQSAGDELAEALLFAGEAPLTAPIRGTSGFQDEFTQVGPRDPAGRSLREFDLSKRLFKYPCSYLIYSRAFDELPAELRNYVWQRLENVLSGKDSSPKFAHLSADDRRAIAAILQATKAGPPAAWKLNN
jgi:hypothetical protein